jgi:hypothetical protein
MSTTYKQTQAIYLELRDALSDQTLGVVATQLLADAREYMNYLDVDMALENTLFAYGEGGIVIPDALRERLIGYGYVAELLGTSEKPPVKLDECK